jgi:hypothetical protein
MLEEDYSTPEKWLESSDKCFLHVQNILEVLSKDKPDWIVIDGSEIVQQVAEMVIEKAKRLVEHKRDVLILLLAVGALTFAVANRPRLRLLPAWKLIWASFCLALSGWSLSALQALFLRDEVVFLEHASYAASSVLAAAWCWKVFAARREGARDVDRNG